ncbi:uncharacterized protein LOC113474348 [Ciona intestinalis]
MVHVFILFYLIICSKQEIFTELNNRIHTPLKSGVFLLKRRFESLRYYVLTVSILPHSAIYRLGFYTVNPKMFCGVCGDSQDDVAFTVCTSCAKVMCAGCLVDHDHVFTGQGKSHHGYHETAQLNHLLKFFMDANVKRSVKCSNKHDKRADYFCEVCQEFTCHTCLALDHQHHATEKLRAFAPQIQRALSGCSEMLTKKRKATLRCAKSLRQSSNEVDDVIENTERIIHRAAKEILFQFSATLRKREEMLKRKLTTELRKRSNIMRGQVKCAELFANIFNEAQEVVEELQSSKSIPLEKDLFANLGVLNKFDVNYITNKRSSQTSPMDLPEMVKIPDVEMEALCSKLLSTKPMPFPRNSSNGQLPTPTDRC